MNKDDFRKSYEGIDYTDEFKAKMRKKLSEPPEIKMTSDKYDNTVEGEDNMKRSRIVHIVSTIAACGVIAVAGGAIAFAMKDTPDKDSKPLTSGQNTSVSTSDTSQTETSATEAVTTQPQTTEEYFNKLGLPDIDPVNDSDETIAKAIRRYATAADEYSFDSMLPPAYPESYGEGNDLNLDGSPLTMDDLKNSGKLIVTDDNWFYAFKSDMLTFESIKEDVYSVYSKDYKLIGQILDSKFMEKNGKVYASWFGGDFAGFHDFSSSRVDIRSKDENKIVADVYMDFTTLVSCGGHGYTIPEQMQYLFPEDYKYEYPQQITLVRENGGWRVSEYIPRHEAEELAKEACPEYQAVLDYNHKDFAYNRFIGTYTNVYDMIGNAPKAEYELNIESIEDNIVTFSLSRYRMFSTDSIKATIDPNKRICAEFDTFGDENNPGIKGKIYLHEALHGYDSEVEDISITLDIQKTEYPYSEPITLTFCQ